LILVTVYLKVNLVEMLMMKKMDNEYSMESDLKRTRKLDSIDEG
jgi:hypothetical protein